MACDVAPPRAGDLTATDGRAGIDAALVARLVAEQFPEWRDLPVTPVPVDGWDNRTYRLGAELVVRLPSAERYASAIEKEDRWLPILAPKLPVAVPSPVAVGVPDAGYPYHWSIRRWLDGMTALEQRPTDLGALASSLAEFLRALQRIDASDGPPPGAHSFYRGATPAHYDEDTRRYVDALAGRIDTAGALAAWDAAVATRWERAPVWFHGDVASGNLLVQQAKLSAVIDFGTCGVGDPACDLVIAWTLFTGPSREAFRAQVRQDGPTWARARGWALWKAMLGLAADPRRADPASPENARIVRDVIAEHRRLAVRPGR